MEKEKNKNHAIEENSQKNLKGMSKFLYVVSKILKVCAIVGIVCLAFVMLIVPFITSNIKTSKDDDQNVLEVFDTKLYYERSDTRVELHEDGKEDKYEITSKSGVEFANEVLEFLEKNDMTKLNLLVELEFLLIIIELVIEVFIFKKASSLFKNIHDEDSPFTEDNIGLLKSIAKLLLCTGVAAFVLSLLNNILLDIELSINIANIIEALSIFVIAYIFEYGYNLQKDSKSKIYSE